MNVELVYVILTGVIEIVRVKTFKKQDTLSSNYSAESGAEFRLPKSKKNSIGDSMYEEKDPAELILPYIRIN